MINYEKEYNNLLTCYTKQQTEIKQLKVLNTKLLEACENFLDRIENASDSMRFTQKAKDLINDTVDEIQIAIAKAR